MDSEFDRLGLLVKRGSFIDATIVQAQRRPPSKEKDDEDEKEERDLDAIQAQSSAKEENPSLRHDDEGIESKEKDDVLKLTKNGKAYHVTDPDARWTVKRNKPHYGYKMHVVTDESGIVRGTEVTPANVHDSRKLKKSHL